MEEELIAKISADISGFEQALERLKRTVGDSARGMSVDFESSFRQLGLRSSQEIEQAQGRIKAALDRIKSDTSSTMEDITRAEKAYEEQTKKLAEEALPDAEKAQKKVSESLLEGAASFSTIKAAGWQYSVLLNALKTPQAAVITGLGLVAFAAFKGASAMQRNAAEVKNLMNVTGLMAEEADNLADTFSLLGQDVNSLIPVMFRLEGMIEQGHNAFTKLGIEVRKSNGEIKTAGELFFEMRKGLSEIRHTGQQAGLSLDFMGRQARNLMSIIKMSEESWQKAAKEAASVSEWTAATQQATDDYKRSVNRLKLESDAFWQVIGSMAIPRLTEMNNLMASLVRHATELAKRQKIDIELDVEVKGTGAALFKGLKGEGAFGADAPAALRRPFDQAAGLAMKRRREEMAASSGAWTGWFSDVDSDKLDAELKARPQRMLEHEVAFEKQVSQAILDEVERRMAMRKAIIDQAVSEGRKSEREGVAAERAILDEREAATRAFYKRELELAAENDDIKKNKQKAVLEAEKKALHEIEMSRLSLTGKTRQIDQAQTDQLHKHGLERVKEATASADAILAAQNETANEIERINMTAREQFIADERQKVNAQAKALYDITGENAQTTAAIEEMWRASNLRIAQYDSDRTARQVAELEQWEQDFKKGLRSEEEVIQDAYDNRVSDLEFALENGLIAEEKFEDERVKAANRAVRALSELEDQRMADEIERNARAVVDYQARGDREVIIRSETLRRIESLEARATQAKIDLAVREMTERERLASRELELVVGTIKGVQAERQKEIDSIRTINEASEAFYLQQLERLEQVKRAQGDVGGFFTASFATALVQGRDFFSNLTDLAQSAAQAIQSFFSDFFFDFFEFNLEKMKDSFVSFLGSIRRAISDFMANAATRAIGEFLSGILGVSPEDFGMSKLGSGVKALDSTAASSAITLANVFVPNVVAAAQAAAAFAQASAVAAMNMGSVGPQDPGGLQEHGGGNASGGGFNFSGLGNNVMTVIGSPSSMSSLFPGIMNIGSNFMGGFAAAGGGFAGFGSGLGAMFTGLSGAGQAAAAGGVPLAGAALSPGAFTGTQGLLGAAGSVSSATVVMAALTVAMNLATSIQSLISGQNKPAAYGTLAGTAAGALGGAVIGGLATAWTGPGIIIGALLGAAIGGSAGGMLGGLFGGNKEAKDALDLKKIRSDLAPLYTPLDTSISVEQISALLGQFAGTTQRKSAINIYHGDTDIREMTQQQIQQALRDTPGLFKFDIGEGLRTGDAREKVEELEKMLADLTETAAKRAKAFEDLQRKVDEDLRKQTQQLMDPALFAGFEENVINPLSDYVRWLRTSGKSAEEVSILLEDLAKKMEVLANLVQLYDTVDQEIVQLTTDFADAAKRTRREWTTLTGSLNEQIDKAKDALFNEDGSVDMSLAPEDALKRAKELHDLVIQRYEFEKKAIEDIENRIAGLLEAAGTVSATQLVSAASALEKRGDFKPLADMISAFNTIQQTTTSATFALWAFNQAITAIGVGAQAAVRGGQFGAIPGKGGNGLGVDVTAIGPLWGQMVGAARPSFEHMGKMISDAISSGDLEGALGLLAQLRAGWVQLATDAIAAVEAWRSTMINATNEAYNNAIDKIRDAAQAQIDLIDLQIEAHQANIEGYQEELELISDRIEGIQEEAQKQVELNQERIEGYQDQLEALNEQLETTRELESAIESIQGYLDDLMLSSAAPLDPRAQFDLAQQRYQDALAQFDKTGSAADALKVQEAAQELLGAAQGIYTRPSPEYQDLFNSIVDQLKSVEDVLGDQIATPSEQLVKEMEALQDQIESLVDLNETISDAAQDEVEALQDAAESLQEQIEAEQDAIEELGKQRTAIEKAAADQIEALELARDAQITAINASADAQVKAIQDDLQKQLESIAVVEGGILHALLGTQLATLHFMTGGQPTQTYMAARLQDTVTHLAAIRSALEQFLTQAGLVPEPPVAPPPPPPAPDAPTVPNDPGFDPSQLGGGDGGDGGPGGDGGGGGNGSATGDGSGTSGGTGSGGGDTAANGMRYVPRDMWVYAHKGESIVTAGETRDRGARGGITINVNVKGGTASELTEDLVRKIEHELRYGRLRWMREGR